MKSRICIAPSPWQLIMLSAALQQAAFNCPNREATKNYLVIQGFGLTDTLENSILKTANHLGNWEQIVQIDEFNDRANLVSNYWNFGKLLKEIAERIGTERADEIWVSKLKGLTQRLIFEAYPGAKIFLYEDGLGTYNSSLYDTYSWKTMVCQPKVFLKLAKKYLIDEFSPYGRTYNGFCLSSFHMRRLSGSYLYLAKYIKNQKFFLQKPQFLIADNILISKIESCASLVENDSVFNKNNFSSGDRWVLLLGQCFALSGFMDVEQEFSVYSQIVSLLLARGYKVFWKEHPRIDRPFFPKLEANYASSNLKNLSTYSTLPIEVFVTQLNIRACVAASSSSLFYLPRIHHIESYSGAELFLPHATGILVTDLNFVIDNISSVNEIPNLLTQNK
jgi:hypothetical protein